MPITFNNLPLELREEILFRSISHEPEVCLAWPITLRRNSSGAYDGPATPFLVDTSYPRAMHVCQSWRATILNSHSQTGIGFRASQLARCLTPYRHFCPETDTMYWGSENMEGILRAVRHTPALQEVQHLAVEFQWGFREDLNFILVLARLLPRVRKLSLVLASTEESTVGRGGRQSFRPPARRCKLRTLSPEDCDRIGPHVVDLIWNWGVEVRLERSGLDGLLDRLTRPLTTALAAIPQLLLFYYRYALSLYPASLCPREMVLGELPGTAADGEAVINRLALDAQTFVEYQGLGRWEEVCGARQYKEYGEMVRSGDLVPYGQRPDLERERPNDIDGAFDVVYEDPGSPRPWMELDDTSAWQ